MYYLSKNHVLKHTEGKIFYPFKPQCIVAYVISNIDNLVDKKEKKGGRRGKKTGYKGTKNNKVILTVCNEYLLL